MVFVHSLSPDSLVNYKEQHRLHRLHFAKLVSFIGEVLRMRDPYEKFIFNPEVKVQNF